MRPGDHPWATNDTFVAGPDIGSDSKTQTLQVHQEDGMYRSRRPAPDVYNWQLNRNFLTNRFLQKMLVTNWSIADSAALHNGDTLGASTTISNSAIIAGQHINTFWFDAGGNQGEALFASGTQWLTPASDPPLAAANAIVSQDVDCDEVEHRVLVAYTPAAGADETQYALTLGGGAWNATTWNPGAPTLDWLSVGCDRNTAGGGAARWLIGDDGVAGTAPPVIWSSPDGIDFTAQAIPGTIIAGQRIGFIGHTLHPVGALGPDDAGNPSWFVLTNARSMQSADGATFTDNGNHGLAIATPNRRNAAYSRVTGRWVVPEGVASAGDITYSDDLGATWTTIVGALRSITAMSNPQIVGDGYGCFVVSDMQQEALWVSVDDGISWTYLRRGGGVHAPTAGWDTLVIDIASDPSNDWDAMGAEITYFAQIFNDDAAPLQEAFITLVY